MNKRSACAVAVLTAVVAVTAGFGWLAAGQRVKETDEAFRTSLAAEADGVLRALESLDVRRVTFSEDGGNTPLFLRVREHLSFFETLPSFKALTLLAYQDGQWKAGPAGHAAEVAPLLEPGAPAYGPDQSPAAPARSDLPIALSRPNRTGDTARFFLPLAGHRSDDLPVMVGFDYSLAPWRNARNAARRPPLAIALILVLLSGAAATLLLQDRRTPPLRRFIEPAWVAAVGLLLTAGALVWLNDGARAEQQRAFDQSVAACMDALRDTVLDLQADVDSLVRFFEGSQYVDHWEFATFIEERAHRAPVQGYYWIPLVRPTERDQFFLDLDAEGLGSFVVWEANGDPGRPPAEDRELWQPVLHAAPHRENRELVGWNLGRDPALRAALERAKWTGLDSATALAAVPLPGMENADWTFLFQPVSALRETGADQQPAWAGSIAALFRMDTVLRRALQRTGPAGTLLQVELNDAARARPEKTAGGSHALEALRPLVLADRGWLVSFRPAAAFAAAFQPRGVPLLGGAGLALTACLTVLTALFRRRQTMLEQLVGRRTAQLKRSENELKTIVNACTESIFLMDGEGLVLAANDNLGRRFSRDPDTITGTCIYDLMPPESAIPWQAAASTVLATRRPVTFEETVDGRVLMHSIYPVPDNGADDHLVVIGMDITYRRKAEEEQKNLELRIQQTQKLESLGVLAGGIAHDFNNILMAVLGHVELALDDLSPVAPARAHLHAIQSATRRAADLCRQMLAYSGVSTQASELLDLAEFIEEMSHLLKASISKKAALNLHLEEGLPPIEADPGPLRQLIMNLILNASEAIGRRSGVISVSAGAVQCDDDYLKKTELHDDLRPGLYVTLEVADTGDGLDDTVRRHIFEPFFTTKFTGRGLGLPAVLGIVRAHHGAIKVYSEARKGTTIKILFPAARAEEAGPPERDAARAQEGTVLVADDEETLRALTAQMLERLGFKVLAAADGVEAVDLFRRRQADIDLVLLDLSMPRMDGAQAFSVMRGMDPEVRIMLMSGFNEQDLAARFAGKGLSAIIQKPFNMRTLRERIEQLREG